jgi:uncharacterized protein (DUF169 family)
MLNEALTRSLNLQWSPVAMAFMSEPPAGLSRIDHPLPAGCAYWKHASEGHRFYTLAEDHYNCTVGAFTHGVTLPAGKANELKSMVGTMIQLQYLRDDEVATIPHRSEPFGIAAYAPLGDAPFSADVVIVRGNARQLMLVSEATRAAGIFEAGATLGRPACSMIPHAIDSGLGVASFGCIGNRVYGELSDNELYVTIPGHGLPGTLAKLETILAANTELEAFHRQRAL